MGADIVTAGLQRCLGETRPGRRRSRSRSAAARIGDRRHVERGVASNYFDLAMIMDDWSERRLNHHSEATSMLYGARECVRLLVEEGRSSRIARHRVAGAEMATGLRAMDLTLFGDQADRMANIVGIEIPAGVDGERVRTRLCTEFEIEIGSSFGPLAGRIWRIGTMGYNCRRDAVLVTLGALEAVLQAEGARVPSGDAVDAAMGCFG